MYDGVWAFSLRWKFNDNGPGKSQTNLRFNSPTTSSILLYI
jgi:hypothetical protein